MASKNAIEWLFDAIENERGYEKIIPDVRKEMDMLDKMETNGLFTQSEIEETLKGLHEILKNVSEGQIRSARSKCNRIKANFITNIKRKLEAYKRKGGSTDVNKDYPMEPPVDYDQTPDNPYSNHAQQNAHKNVSPYREGYWGHVDPMKSPSQTHGTYPDHRKSVVEDIKETDKMRKSQKASEAMRHNNPDIADLSDTNRPTKIAERFSELYDNEWVEVFDILCNKKKTEEKKITQLLLKIVEEAYAFCKQEAEQQISAMHSAIIEILEYGETKGILKKEQTLDASLLVQYRKEYASKAIKRLQKEFFEKKLKNICATAIGGMPPGFNGPTAKYGQKAVELSWWMCVQDPPVHMVPTKESFNPDFFRAYTKSGKRPDFFVWPALKLHENGGLMTKGVVQFQ